MNQFSFFTKSSVKFNNPPVSFNDFDGVFDYAETVGAEKYAYNTYRHFLLPYLTNPKEQTVFDINCAKGYGLATLKKQYGFKKCIGYQQNQELLDICKQHADIAFYKDFIMSKQTGADFVFSLDAFGQYDNKSALLLKLSQILNPNGKLIIVQNTFNEKEYAQYETILQKTHGLKKIYSGDITQHVYDGVNFIAKEKPFVSPPYAEFVERINYSGAKYKVTIMEKV